MKTTPNSPLVTIAIPTYNRCSLLHGALESALAQVGVDFEVLVCDNASDDGTEELLSQYGDPRLRIVRHAKNLGLIGNWNSCLGNARGDFLLMLSDDDCLMPTALMDLTAAYGLALGQGMKEADDSVAFAYGRCEFKHLGSGSVSLSAEAPAREQALEFQVGVLMGTRVSYPSATLLRCADARACGGYSRRFMAAIDSGMVFQIASRRACVAFTNRPTTRYTMHTTNFTSNIALPDLAATMAGLAKVAWLGAARSATTVPAQASRALRSAPAKAVADLICERQRRGSIGTAAALRSLWELRSLFLSETSWVIGTRAAAKILLRAWPRRIAGASD